MFGIEIPAKDKNADQRRHKEDDTKYQPDVPPDKRQIQHRREHGGHEEQQPEQRGEYHFFYHDTILHNSMISGARIGLP